MGSWASASWQCQMMAAEDVNGSRASGTFHAPEDWALPVHSGERTWVHITEGA
ncbi:MAG: hypothetical protein ACR2JU_15115 [Nocardioidaceae bacterium]